MTQAAIYVGVDISKAVLDVYIDRDDEYFQVSHDESGVAQLIERLQPLGVTLVVLAATGGLERLVVSTLKGLTTSPWPWPIHAACGPLRPH